ncbi:alkaline phosphatase [Aurantibacter crassamenti]|uniref:alkaline phosphatase n=1 Tax=Aurantibacter crassamenti TaxID=1837375 RepID=UPI00193ABA31|nr:alkaline phosphatase [Aurantibacter crassamenti]MBM1105080.1 alkaline phosphatase [Aurantibacter crassamenti]
MKKIIFLLFLITTVSFAQQSNNYRVHSHNDYFQNVPFWKAVSAGATSVEADVFLVDEKLLVAHDKHELKANRNLEELYLNPLVKSLKVTNLGEKPFQLLLDIKSEAYTTLDAIVTTLKMYPALINNENLSIVISGNRPKVEDYINYPEFIHFDYQSLDTISDASILNKIALVSLSFKKFSFWNGKGRLTAEDLTKVSIAIDRAHALGKPFRFWATPDSKTAWKAMVNLGVDFINTDMPFNCVAYVQKLDKSVVQNSQFSEVYKPSFASDQKDNEVENVILLIGDGNGITQISATSLANNGELSLTKLKSIGFLKTQSSDDFTTDSAAAGTALATGEKVPNRAIGVDANGSPIENLTELLSRKKFVSGIVTTDNVAGATPSSFYAHQKDRDMSDEIGKDLVNSKISFFVSRGLWDANTNKNIDSFEMMPSLESLGSSKKKRLSYLMNDNSELASAAKNTLRYLKSSKKQFFLMIEGAKIDSYGHENDISGVIRESIQFDRAIAEALKFADQNPKTLVIITADHETGGLTIPQGNIENHEIEGEFSTRDHTAVMVPIFAYGPRSNEFQGVYENNLVFSKILKVLEIQP